jgi:D-sedoheptulose 7-phosphate isomerase
VKDTIMAILADTLEVTEKAVRENADTLLRGAEMISQSLASGHKILIFGNGGSAADAQHIAAEFVNRFRIERPPLAALALTTDTSIITSVGNDYHFDDIFSKQVRALGQKDDVAMGISTSGNSGNVIKAMETAREMGLFTIAMTGGSGRLKEGADLVFNVVSDTTARVQEAHITLMHILCELVDRTLFVDRL